MEFRKTESGIRRMSVSAIIRPVTRSGELDTSRQAPGDVEVVSSHERHFTAPGQLEEEVDLIRRSGDWRFTRPYRRNVVSLGENPEIRYQKPRAIRLGFGVLHTGGWQTIESWPYRVPSVESD